MFLTLLVNRVSTQEEQAPAAAATYGSGGVYGDELDILADDELLLQVVRQFLVGLYAAVARSYDGGD